MRFRFFSNHRGDRLAGIMALILSLVHAPLPQPDFHNIRHQDGAGEVCEYHDHLLRWHPGAGVASDVAVLHWHWFLPTAESDSLGSNPNGLAIHAHNTDWDATTVEVAQISADTSVRLDLRVPSLALESIALDSLAGPFSLHKFSSGRSPISSCAPFARGISVQALLNRWVC